MWPPGELLECRGSLAANIRRQVGTLREEEAAERSAAAMPSYGTTVSVTSQSQASWQGKHGPPAFQSAVYSREEERAGHPAMALHLWNHYGLGKHSPSAGAVASAVPYTVARCECT